MFMKVHSFRLIRFCFPPFFSVLFKLGLQPRPPVLLFFFFWEFVEFFFCGFVFLAPRLVEFPLCRLLRSRLPYFPISDGAGRSWCGHLSPFFISPTVYHIPMYPQVSSIGLFFLEETVRTRTFSLCSPATRPVLLLKLRR